jgi:hypothetical protein
MASGTTERALVLVPAFPQPRSRYEETVGCAALTPEGRFVRLYPWRFRQLRPEQRFACWDLIEYQTEFPADDRRPETRYVDARSVRVLRRAEAMTPEQRMRLWEDHPCPSLSELQQANLTQGASLGVVRPDEGSLRLQLRALTPAPQDVALQEAYRQVALVEAPALARQPVELELSYRFTSQGHEHELRILDWEAHATYLRYKRKNPGDALQRLRHKYEQRIPARYLHLVVSTLKASPLQFFIIGLLRHGASLEEVTREVPLLDGASRPGDTVPQDLVPLPCGPAVHGRLTPDSHPCLQPARA